MVMKSEQKNNVQCAVVGDGMVGKTCMSLIFAKTISAGDKTRTADEYIATVFDNYAGKTSVNGDEFAVSIFDSAGEHEYESLREFAYRDSEVFVVCFSVVDRDSFDSVRDFWAPEMKNNMQRKKPFIVVATQTDLRNTMDYDNDMPISAEEGLKMAKEIGASNYIECSVKEQTSVKAVFTEVVQIALKYRKKKSNIVNRLLGK